MPFTRITVNPSQMGGVPSLRGLRIPVATVVGLVAEGQSEKQILDAYPDLEAEDVHEALRSLRASKNPRATARRRESRPVR